MLHSLDHVALVVRDLNSAVGQYRTLLAREPNWRGADGGAEHAWFQLSNVALDVIAPIGAGYTGDRVEAQLEAHGEGLWAIAFATPDIHKEVRRLARCGAPASEPRSVRSTNVATGERRYWTTSVLDAACTYGVAVLLIDQPPDAPTWPLSDAAAPESASIEALDHVVITTTEPERAAALYGARLDLEMALDRTNPDWGARLMFFRCGDLVVEIAHDLRKDGSGGPDGLWGLSWRAPDLDAAHARLVNAGVNVSEIRPGRKPGTRVFTARDHTCGVPTIVIGRPDTSPQGARGAPGGESR